MGVKIDEYRRWPVPFLHCGDSGDLWVGKFKEKMEKLFGTSPTMSR